MAGVEMNGVGESRVLRESLAACMRCPLCQKLYREATTISECLHTFCMKCIYDKITDEEIDRCPQCDMYLGCTPTEKLRPDHTVRDIVGKIFPKLRKETQPNLLPPPRKERSISSLVVDRRASAQTGLTRKRTKASARRNAALVIDEPGKEDRHLSDPEENPSSPETLNKLAQNRRKSTSSALPSNDFSPNKSKENGEQWGEDEDLINFLVDAANQKKFSKHNIPNSSFKTESSNASPNGANLFKTKTKKGLPTSEVNTENNGTPSSPGLKKFHKVGRKKKAAPKEAQISPQAIVASNGPKRDTRLNPVWLKFVASTEWVGSAPLPQISNFLRIVDSNAPVSCVQKYIATKLNISNETEVEITCQEQVVLPSMPMYDVVNLYLKAYPTLPEQVLTAVGRSAEQFMVVLGYSLKILPQ